MKRMYQCLVLLAVVFATGCSINHPVADDYPQYLDNNKGEQVFTQSALDADYRIDQETVNHRYEFRAATVGYAHLWIVEFGKILDATLRSADVQAAFQGLDVRPAAATSSGNVIDFRLDNYEFKNHHAFVSLNIAFASDGTEVLNKTYHAEGKSQGSKMFWGGPFAMKNATQQSTKIAVDEILEDFIQDINRLPLATR